MGWYKIKIRKTDTDYSKYIRTKANWKCEICGRNDIGLEASHYFGRVNQSVRFDDRNVHCLCKTCHRKAHEPGYYYRDWLVKTYGQKWFDKLTIDAHTTGKKDYKLQAIINKELLKSIDSLNKIN